MSNLRLPITIMLFEMAEYTLMYTIEVYFVTLGLTTFAHVLRLLHINCDGGFACTHSLHFLANVHRSFAGFELTAPFWQ